MKPLNIDKTGCSNTSSNCVVWQGPDIECINLCKGDSITEVVYKLALELCNLMETFDLKNYDLQCFSTGVCQPQNFKDFINILINKVCTLQACNPQCGDSCTPCPTSSSSSILSITDSGSSDPFVPIALAFQFKNQTGDDVTTLKVSDYAQAIGNKVSSIVNSVASVQQSILDHTERIEALEKQGPPEFVMPTIIPVSVLPKEATSMQLVIAATEQQFSEVRAALGDANNIYTNLQKIDPNISDLKSLSIPGTNMSGLRGFTAQPSNLADVLGNTLIMLSDMRIALTNIITNYIPSACEAISLSIDAIVRNNQFVLYINGTLPAANFVNTNGVATKFSITDNHGSVVEYSIDIFSIINLPDGYIIDISGTRLVTSDNLTITANPSFTHKTSGSICKSYLSTIVINQGICPSVSYVPTSSTIAFAFTSNTGTQAYSVEVWNSAGTNIIASQTFVSNNVQAFTGTFSGLQSTTLYKLRIKISINGVDTPCEYSSVTTI